MDMVVVVRLWHNLIACHVIIFESKYKRLMTSSIEFQIKLFKQKRNVAILWLQGDIFPNPNSFISYTNLRWIAPHFHRKLLLHSKKWSLRQVIVTQHLIVVQTQFNDFLILLKIYIYRVSQKSLYPPNEICLSIFKYILNLFHYDMNRPIS